MKVEKLLNKLFYGGLAVMFGTLFVGILIERLF